MEIANTDAINFGEDDDYTIIVWMKFDLLSQWATPFSKSYAPNYAQYDLYYDNTSYPATQSTPAYSALFEVDVCSACVGFDNMYRSSKGAMLSSVTLDTSHWYMITLRNKVQKSPSSPAANNANNHVVDVFWNGYLLNGSRATNNVSSSSLRCNAKLILGAMRFWAGQNSGDGSLGCFLNGRIDEFLVFKRALQDSEIRGHFMMGQEHNY